MEGREGRRGVQGGSVWEECVERGWKGMWREGYKGGRCVMGGRRGCKENVIVWREGIEGMDGGREGG